ncbi:hypothetical protein ACNVED_01985 [Legionella sp. D16C41]|uniref:hypothetical protein n=1 Tax=Legionella sp. D16C41 TaxID=3402688 RepID=UPI003AF820FF
MHNFSSQNSMITIYETAARNLTVVQGNSGVIYPFYKSSGKNSGFEGIWAPWMGYFAEHPKAAQQIYMVKPSTASLSSELIKIIEAHCTKLETESLMARMGNDEALAISCALGGGVWTERPSFCEAIKNAVCIKPFLKEIIVHHVETVSLPTSDKENPAQTVNFKGKNYKGNVLKTQAEMATIMEKIITQESANIQTSKKFNYVIQDRKKFPTTKQLKNIASEVHGLTLRTNYYHKLGLFKKEPGLADNLVKGKAKVTDLPSPSKQG